MPCLTPIGLRDGILALAHGNMQHRAIVGCAGVTHAGVSRDLPEVWTSLVNEAPPMPLRDSSHLGSPNSPSCSALAWYSCWPELFPWGESGDQTPVARTAALIRFLEILSVKRKLPERVTYCYYLIWLANNLFHTSPKTSRTLHHGFSVSKPWYSGSHLIHFLQLDQFRRS